jgi:hypothetical protein
MQRLARDIKSAAVDDLKSNIQVSVNEMTGAKKISRLTACPARACQRRGSFDFTAVFWEVRLVQRPTQELT